MFKSVKSSKKLLAILLSIAIVCSVFSFYCVNVMAGTQESENLPAFNKSSGAEITLADGGVWMEGGETDWVSQTLEVGAKPVITMMPVIEIGESANVAITADSIIKNGVVDYSDAKGLILKLTRKAETTLEVYYYNTGSAWELCGTNTNVNFDNTISLSWAIAPMRYRLLINGSTQTVDISERIYQLDDESVFTFFAKENENGFTFKNTRIDSDAGDDFTFVRSSGTVEVTGDVENGCTFKNIYNETGGLDTLLTYNRAFDFDNIEFTFKASDMKNLTGTDKPVFNIMISTFAGFRSYINSDGTEKDGVDVNNSTGDTFYLGFKKHSTGVYVMKNGKDGAYINLTDASNAFDYNAVHTISFAKVGTDYKLCLDGNIIGATLTDFVKNLEGKKVFVTVNPQGYCLVDNFRIRSNSSATSAEEQPTGLTSNEASAVIGGDEINGYTATGTATGQTNGTFVNLLDPIDINSDAIRYGNNNLQTAGWAQIAISNTPNSPSSIYAGDTDVDYNMLRINLVYQSWGVQYRLYMRGFNSNDPLNFAYSTFNNSTASKSDVLYFKKDETDGKWDIYCNGTKVLHGSDAQTAYDSARGAMSPVLDKLAQGKAYVHFTNFSSASGYYDIKPQPISASKTNTAVTSGNAYAGYTLTSTTNDDTVKLFTPIDINKQEVNFKFDNTQAWKIFSLTSDSSSTVSNFIYNSNAFDVNGLQNSQDVVFFRLTPVGTELHVYAHYADRTGATKTVPLLCKVTNFDFTKSHKFGFYKVKGNWRLVIDGEIHVTGEAYNHPDHPDYQTIINTELDALSAGKKAYLQLYSYGSPTGFSDVKFTKTNYSFNFSYDFDKNAITRNYNSLKIGSVADGVKVNFVSGERNIYSGVIGNGLNFKIWNDQEMYAKFVYPDGSTALTRICSAGDVSENGTVDIRSLVAMRDLVAANGSQYNSDVDGDNVTDNNDTVAVRNILLGVGFQPKN